MPIINTTGMYIHRDEQLRWRWYFYTSSGVCLASQKSYETRQEAVVAMQDYDAE